MPPVYVVSGMQRSGTSMMMVALHKGGMDAVWDESRNASIQKRLGDDQYTVNAAGLHELSDKEYKSPDFPVGYEGKLIKALQMGPANMNVMPDGIKVVWMWREPEEIRQSYDALTGRNVWTREQVEKRQRRSREGISNRRDSLMHIVNFRELVDNPRPNFERVANFLGKPLDIDAMVNHVDASQVRFKSEELTVGII